MPIAMMTYWAVSEQDACRRDYDEIHARIGFPDDPPQGLIVHSAGTTADGGWRIFEIWESRERIEDFMAERLVPTWRELSGPSAPPPSTTEVTELHGLFLAPPTDTEPRV